MAKPFDPKKVLLHLSPLFLKQFFAAYAPFADLDWEALGEGDIGPVYERWMALVPQQRRETQLLLQDVYELAEPAGLVLLAQEIRWHDQRHLEPFAAIEGQADKALWTYLHLREPFTRAALFARTRALSTGRYWEKRNGLPRQALVVTEEMKDELGTALVKFYSTAQGRGFRHHVDHSTREGGDEYFFVYLDDYPDNSPAFDDQGKFLRRPGQHAFDNIFVYSSKEGTLELYAQGDRKVHDALQKGFGTAVLGKEIDPDHPDRPVFALDHLKHANCPFPTEPTDRIAEVRIRGMRIQPCGVRGRSLLLKADPKGPPNDIHGMLDGYLNPNTLTRANVQVTRVEFQLTFMSDSFTKPKKLLFDVNPRSCNLKSKPEEERLIGERCLKLWKIAA